MYSISSGVTSFAHEELETLVGFEVLTSLVYIFIFGSVQSVQSRLTFGIIMSPPSSGLKN
jgi:hypothetical protein